MITYVQLDPTHTLIISGEKTAIGPRAVFSTMTEPQLNAAGWWTVIDVPPGFNPATQSLTASGLAVLAGIPTRQYVVNTLPVPLTPQQVAQALINGSDPMSVTMRGLIIVLAGKFSITPAQAVTAIVNAAN